MKYLQRKNVEVTTNKTEYFSRSSSKHGESPALNYALNVLIPDFLVFVIGTFSAMYLMLLIFKYI